MLPESKQEVQKLLKSETSRKGDFLKKEIKDPELKKNEKISLENVPPVVNAKGERRFVNESAFEKGILFQNATANWLRKESKANTGKER